MSKTQIRFVAAIPLLIMLVTAGCSKDEGLRFENISWERMLEGLQKDPGSDEYMASILTLLNTWQEHGEEGVRLGMTHGLEYVGLWINGAAPGAANVFDAPAGLPRNELVAKVLSRILEVADKDTDENYRVMMQLMSAWAEPGKREMQELVEMADAGVSNICPAARLCLAPLLSDAIIKAARAPSTERGRVFQEALPGWPSPPTREITQTLFPANLSRLSRWISDGISRGGSHAAAWRKVAARLEGALGPRLFDLPVVMSADPRPGSPLSAIIGRLTPLELVHVKAGGVAVALRPVLEWNDSFMSVVSAAATWSEQAGTEPVDLSLDTLAARLAAQRELASRLEKGVYPTLVGTAMGDRIGRSILVLVDSDAQADTLMKAVSILATAGYSDFRLLAQGAPGSVNPFMEARDTGSLSTSRTARVFLSRAGASLFPNPPGEFVVDFMPSGVEPIPSENRVNGLFVAWDATRGFSSSLAQAFSSLGLSAAGRVDIVDIVPTDGSLPAQMIVDAITELEASPGVQYSKFEPYFPGLSCPQGRTCPGVMPVLGNSFPVPAAAR